jgi:toxin ParE1/3/4
MKVIFSPLARERLRQIQSYIAQENVAAAARVASTIRASTEILSEYPEIGRIHEGEIRRLNVSRYPYAIFYRVDAARQEVIILTIRHGYQLPTSFS